MKLISFGKYSLTVIGALTAFVALSLPAYATEETTESTVACDADCGDGMKLSSFADGNSATCSCVAEGVMEATVPDPSVLEGPITTDSE
jgi:hypothetical protein